MTEEYQILFRIIQTVLFVAAVAATIVPIVYAFSPWHSSALGRAFMTQAIAFAVILDLTTLYSIWRPASLYLRFWTQLIAFILVAYATARIAIFIWHTNYRK